MLPQSLFSITLSSTHLCDSKKKPSRFCRSVSRCKCLYNSVLFDHVPNSPSTNQRATMSLPIPNEMDKIQQTFSDALTIPIAQRSEQTKPYIFIKDLGQWPIRTYALGWDRPSTFLTPRPLASLREIVKSPERLQYPEVALAKCSEGFERADVLFYTLVHGYLIYPYDNSNTMPLHTSWTKFCP